MNGLPEWANTGLSAVAKVLPALGFALLLNLLLDKKLIPYFIIGFCLSAYLNMSLIGVFAISYDIAYIIYIERKNKTNFALSINVKDNSEDEGDEL